MNSYVYSPSQNMILPVALKQLYVEAGTWPDDVTELSDETAEMFRHQYSFGKVMFHDENNQPCWIDAPPPTEEEQRIQAENKKNYLMAQARRAILPLQDAADLGIATANENAALLAWKKYCVLLYRTDISQLPVSFPPLPFS